MTALEFRNGLCALMAIDKADLTEAGLSVPEPYWRKFRQDPFRQFVILPPSARDRLWPLIERRLKGQL